MGTHALERGLQPGEVQSFSRRTLLVKENMKPALAASRADLASELAVVKAAIGVIVQVQPLLHRNEEILKRIAWFRAVL